MILELIVIYFLFRTSVFLPDYGKYKIFSFRFKETTTISSGTNQYVEHKTRGFSTSVRIFDHSNRTRIKLSQKRKIEQYIVIKWYIMCHFRVSVIKSSIVIDGVTLTVDRITWLPWETSSFTKCDSRFRSPVKNALKNERGTDGNGCETNRRCAYASCRRCNVSGHYTRHVPLFVCSAHSFRLK